MKDDILEYMDQLFQSEVFDDNLEMSVWKSTPVGNDLSVTRCTSSAMLIADKFGGSVWGYEIIDDMYKDKIGYWSGGHDFAIVGKYLVDYWAKYVNDEKQKSILDMTDRTDQDYIMKNYLPITDWKNLPIWRLTDEA